MPNDFFRKNKGVMVDGLNAQQPQAPPTGLGAQPQQGPPMQAPPPPPPQQTPPPPGGGGNGEAGSFLQFTAGAPNMKQAGINSLVPEMPEGFDPATRGGPAPGGGLSVGGGPELGQVQAAQTAGLGLPSSGLSTGAADNQLDREELVAGGRDAWQNYLEELRGMDTPDAFNLWARGGASDEDAAYFGEHVAGRDTGGEGMLGDPIDQVWDNSVELNPDGGPNPDRDSRLEDFLGMEFNQDFSSIEDQNRAKLEEEMRRFGGQMNAFGMSQSGAAAGMGSDIVQSSMRDLASSRLDFDQQRIDNEMKRAELLFRDRWQELSFEQQREMAGIMAEHEMEIARVLNAIQEGNVGEAEDMIKQLDDALPLGNVRSKITDWLRDLF